MIVSSTFLRRILTGLALLSALPVLANAGNIETDLPVRNSPAPQTTNNVPHVQFNVQPKPEYKAELTRQASALPGVKLANTGNSLAGAIGFRLNHDAVVANPSSLLPGREFAHLHSDGSLHLFLDPQLAERVIEAGWGTYHPWAGQNPGWDGFVMLYTPTSNSETETVARLVEASYGFVTGKSVENGYE